MLTEPCPKPYFVYILRCEDGSVYTGITNQLERRMQEHFGRTEKCAKYTASHPPVRVERVWQTADRSDALRLEARIKRLPKKDKERLIAEPDTVSRLSDGPVIFLQ